MVAPVAMPLRVVLGNAATAEHNAAVLKAAFQVRTEGRHAPEDRASGRAAALRALMEDRANRELLSRGWKANVKDQARARTTQALQHA